MKGVIVQNIKEVVTEKFGEDDWNQVVEHSEADNDIDVEPGDEIPDSKIMSVVDSIKTDLGLSQEQVWKAFAHHWIQNFTPRMFPEYFEAENSKMFLMRLDAQHWDLRNKFENLTPPQFVISMEDEETMEITYMSERGLIDLAVEIVREVGEYYDDEIEVEKLDEKHIEVNFIDISEDK